MYSPVQLATKYIRYYITSANGKGHGIHSPFVFDFVKNVLNDTIQYDAYEKIESLRLKLLRDKKAIQVEDLGAGSSFSGSKTLRISDIARRAAKPRKFGQLLFRIARYYKPVNIVELGTSLGLTTSYLAAANSNALVHTIEGSTQVAAIAASNFEELALENVLLKEGNFDDVLPAVVHSLSAVDFAFIDGNHRKLPTLKYFNLLTDKINTSSILIFDDIHWSKEMEEAWEKIKAYPGVRLSIDLFFIGLVFFREELKAKQHFVIRF